MLLKRLRDGSIIYTQIISVNEQGTLILTQLSPVGRDAFGNAVISSGAKSIVERAKSMTRNRWTNEV